MKSVLLCAISVCFLFLGSCASKKITNVEYLEQKIVKRQVVGKMPTLNIFQPKEKNSKTNPVIIFIHGGNWNSGSKEIYSVVGRNFAKKRFRSRYSRIYAKSPSKL